VKNYRKGREKSNAELNGINGTVMAFFPYRVIFGAVVAQFGEAGMVLF